MNKQCGPKVLKEFAAKYSWHKQMSESRGLDSYDNYGGESLGDLVVVPGISRSRDSDILAESNFASALDALGGESKSVQVHRFGHWGCGWFEIITVDPSDSTALSKAIEIHEWLQDYPVLDDSDFSEREYEYMSDYADQSKSDLADALMQHFGLDFAKGALRSALEDLAYRLQMECQMYAGTDSSCINVYTCREPDERDLKRLVECLNQCDFNNDTQAGPDSLQQALAEYLMACLDGVQS